MTPADGPHIVEKDVRDGFAGAIGNTPLIRLDKASEATGCEILGKAEFLNPGGSVKDRAALYISKDAEERGALRPGGVVVEGTAGNTGIGLALVGNARGYRTVIVIPETQSREKLDMLRLCGAELRLVPAKPYRDPGNYVRVSERVAAELGRTDTADRCSALRRVRVFFCPSSSLRTPISSCRRKTSLGRTESSHPWNRSLRSAARARTCPSGQFM